MSPEQRRTLEAWVRAQNTPQSVVLRARIALRAADGLANTRIAQELDISRPTVVLWRGRFKDGGPTAGGGGLRRRGTTSQADRETWFWG